jgi:rare lipoprotein A
VLLGSSLVVPSVGLAAAGGASVLPPGGTQPPNRGGPSVVHSGNVTVTATGGGITLSSRASALLRNQLRFSGHLSSSAAGATIEIERLGHQTQWAWAPTAHAIVQGDGSFSGVWDTNHIGQFSIRALIQKNNSSSPAAASPTLTVTVYRPSLATQYGPGFYGSQTACGEVLRRNTLGVANRTLKCGTPVAIYYQGRTIVVPVIDRGPYANGADWDLTEATGSALGIDGTATIGAVSLPPR